MSSRLASHLAAALLTFAVAAPASADTVVNTYYLPFNPGPGLTQYTSFDDTFTSSGTSFVDDFIFSAPPPQSDVQFTFMSGFSSSLQAVSFTGFSLSTYQPGGTSVPVALDWIGGSVFASGWTTASLDVGNYVLEITGTTLVDAATFSGTLTATVPVAAPVPEPATWGLFAAGLGVLGVATRRRRQRGA